MTVKPANSGAGHPEVLAFLAKLGFEAFDDVAFDESIMAPSLNAVRSAIAAVSHFSRRDGQRFHAVAVFLKRRELRAFAVDLGNVHLFAVSAGMNAMLFEMAAFSLSQAGLFTDIGESHKEDSVPFLDQTQLGFWLSNSLNVVGGMPSNIKDLLPRDPTRRAAVVPLVHLMLRFVWYHEIFHGLNGHCGLLKAARDGSMINELKDDHSISAAELEGAEPAFTTREINHLFEYDADFHALNMVVGLQLAESDQIQNLSYFPQHQRLRLTFFAAFLVTFLFEQTKRRSGRRWGTSHPSPQRRLENLLRHYPFQSSYMNAIAIEERRRAFAEFQSFTKRILGFNDWVDNLSESKGDIETSPSEDSFYYLKGLRKLLSSFSYTEI